MKKLIPILFALALLACTEAKLKKAINRPLTPRQQSESGIMVVEQSYNSQGSATVVFWKGEIAYMKTSWDTDTSTLHNARKAAIEWARQMTAYNLDSIIHIEPDRPKTVFVKPVN